MTARHGASRCGLCILKVETDASAGLLITVTSRPDLDDRTCESVRHPATAEAALACVAEFLASVAPDDGRGDAAVTGR